MAYKYFTEKLLSSNMLDLSTVFPEKQELARDSNNVSYNLTDIALFLKDRTENFKRLESQYIDLDSAISQIVEKYYKSKGEKNPFVTDLDEESLEEFQSKTPREAAIVDKGEIKSKGAVKAAPDVEKKKTESKKSEKKVESKDDSRKKILDELESVKDSFTLFGESEQDEIIGDYEIEISALELLDDDEEAQLRLKILRDEFIPELKRLKA